jgi:hypothetical protein
MASRPYQAYLKFGAASRSEPSGPATRLTCGGDEGLLNEGLLNIPLTFTHCGLMLQSRLLPRNAALAV